MTLDVLMLIGTHRFEITTQRNHTNIRCLVSNVT